MKAMQSYVRFAPDATPAELITVALQTSRRMALIACPAKRRKREITSYIQLQALKIKLLWIIQYLQDGEDSNA